MTPEIDRTREELEWLRSRYDSGAVSDAVYITISVGHSTSSDMIDEGAPVGTTH
jgi:hypothetical protein